MATLPAGTLMQRAATGLATAVIDLLGGAYGRRVLLLVGPGDNGGDALYAGALLARRGAQVRGAAAGRDRATRRVWPPCGGPAVASSSRRRSRRPTWSSTGSSGSAAVRACGHRPSTPSEPWPAGRWSPSTSRAGVDVDTGRIDGAHVTADLTVTFGTHKVCHLVEPAASACGVVQLVDIGLDLPEAAVDGAPDRRRRRAAAAARRSRPEVHPRRRRRPGRLGSATRAPACSRRPARRAGWPAWCGTPVGHRTPSAPGTRRSSSERAASRPGSSGPAATPTRAEALDGRPARRRTARRRRRRPPAPRRRRSTGRPCSPRTPASSPRCSASSAPRSRRTSSPAPGMLPASTPPPCCSRATTRWSPRRTAGCGSPRPARRGSPSPAPVTCSAGLCGALLAAGLTPYDAGLGRLLAARRRRDPGLPGWPDSAPRRSPTRSPPCSPPCSSEAAFRDSP